MKFFKSKYYTDLTDVKISTASNTIPSSTLATLVTLHDGNRQISITDQIFSRYTMRFSAVQGYAVDMEKVINEWELVTDLTSPNKTTTDKCEVLNIDNLVVRTYFDKVSECFITARTIDNEIIKHVRTTLLRVPIMVNPENIFSNLLERGFINKYVKKVKPKIGILIQDRSGFNIRYSDIADIDINFDTMYSNGFAKTSDKILDNINDETLTGLYILHGDAGTGKTSYIKWLTKNTKRNMIIVPPDMVTALTKPAFIEFLLNNKGLVFIVEDAEASLTNRLGSANSIVSTILNLSDGILADALKCQFICTFNTALTNVDTALLRPGRLLVRHKFNKLTTEESNAYLKSVGVDITVDKESSLSELMNIENMPITSVEKTKRSIGFNTQH